MNRRASLPVPVSKINSRLVEDYEGLKEYMAGGEGRPKRSGGRSLKGKHQDYFLINSNSLHYMLFSPIIIDLRF